MKADTDAYLKIMREIKYRVEVVTWLMNGDIDMRYDGAQVESIALQMRMIIESIALASLSANKTLFEEMGDDFKKFWKAKYIFQDIERVNPDFFPKLVKVHRSESEMDIIIDESFVTQSQIIKVYLKFCKVLHANNPYAGDRDYQNILNMAKTELRRIIKLLKSHLVKLIHDDEFYIVTIGNPDESPVMTHVKMIDPVYGPKW